MLFNRDRPPDRTEARRAATRRRVALADAPPGQRLAIGTFCHLLRPGGLTAIAMVLGPVAREMPGLP